LKDGKVVRDASQLKAGDEIETRLKKGNVKSIVK
jgi:exonuclease VII large subunit